MGNDSEELNKIKLSGGQTVSAEYVERLSQMVLSFSEGVCQITPEDQHIHTKLQELMRVILKTVRERELSGLSKQIIQFFDNKKMEGDFRKLERAGFVEMIRELSKSLGQLMGPESSLDEDLQGFIEEMEQANDPKAILAAKDKIINAVRSVQNNYRAIRDELHKIQEHFQQIQSRIVDTRSTDIVDGRTQILNRDAFDMKLEESVKKFRKDREPFFVALVDIDDFKTHSQKHGDEATTNILQSIAYLVKESVGNNDFVFRFGNDQFSILFYGTTYKKVQVMAERIRERVETVRTHLVNDLYADKEKRVRITVTIGLAQSKEGDNEQSFLKRVVDAMKRGKGEGRNCVAIS